jgi:hypothetical protein
MVRRSRRSVSDVAGVMKQFTAIEAEQWLARWLAAFGQRRHGVNAKDFLWHIFSAGRHPSVDADEARAAYMQHEATRYVVLSNDQHSVFLLDRKPVDWPEPDYNVFPENLAWTMAFTHEEGWLGPYFSKHADYEWLEPANRQGLEKRRQVEAARARGWC